MERKSALIGRVLAWEIVSIVLMINIINTVQYSKAVGWINSAGILDTRRAAGAPFRVLQ